jgi:hypothetical protein
MLATSGLGGRCGDRHDHVGIELDQLGGHIGQSIVPAVREPPLDADVLALIVTERAEFLPEGFPVIRPVRDRAWAEEADSRNLRLGLGLGIKRRGEKGEEGDGHEFHEPPPDARDATAGAARRQRDARAGASGKGRYLVN